MTTTERSSRRGTGGFTIAELLLVVAITSIGFVALLQLQVATIRGADGPARLSSAASLAEHVLSTVRMEAVEWLPGRSGSTPEDSTRWVYLSRAMDQANVGQWLQVYLDLDGEQKLVDQGGGDAIYDEGLLEEFAADDRPRFCVFYRASWASSASKDSVRVDVAVAWLTDAAEWSQYKSCPVEMVDAVEFGQKHIGKINVFSASDTVLGNSAAARLAGST